MPTAQVVPYWPASLTTERLLLRPVVEADTPVLTRLWTDVEVRRYLGGPLAEEAARTRARRCVGVTGLFTVVRRLDDTALGSVFVAPEARDGRTEVSYQLVPEYWGSGYAQEAVAAAVRWAAAEVPARVPGVVAVTQAANESSRRLLERLGATPAGTFVEWNAPQVTYRFDHCPTRPTPPPQRGDTPDGCRP
ncbi:GNAT family N-acetyltransferase [Streptomyces sp. NPDC001388]|uniref:GNAT family N-acetyltransferase n=1 Tax=Streptomyces sp. NPDC001388 TaxID=3364568 RepID=UPI0036AB2C32